MSTGAMVIFELVILEDLGEKTGQFLLRDTRGRSVLERPYRQVGGWSSARRRRLSRYSPQKIEYVWHRVRGRK